MPSPPAATAPSPSPTKTLLPSFLSSKKSTRSVALAPWPSTTPTTTSISSPPTSALLPPPLRTIPILALPSSPTPSLFSSTPNNCGSLCRGPASAGPLPFLLVIPSGVCGTRSLSSNCLSGCSFAMRCLDPSRQKDRRTSRACGEKGRDPRGLISRSLPILLNHPPSPRIQTLAFTQPTSGVPKRFPLLQV